MLHEIEGKQKNEVAMHSKYGEMVRDNIYFKRDEREPVVIGSTKDGDSLIKTKELSKYTILKPDGKMFVITHGTERIQGGKEWHSLESQFVVQEHEDTEAGGIRSKQVATGDYAEAVYTMIKNTPDANQDEISRFVSRMSRAQKYGHELALEAVQDLGWMHGKSDVASAALVSNLSRIDR